MKKFSSISRLFVIIAVLTLGALSAWGATYTVAGGSTAIINGSATWSPTVTANDMTNVTGTWWALLVTGKTLSNNTNYQFKVCKDHAWTTAYPSSNYDMYVTNGGAGFNIIYTYNSSGNAVTAVPFQKWTVAGSSAVLGSNWSTTDASNAMTEESTYVYTLTKSNVSLTAGTTYECKVVPNVANPSNDWWFPSSSNKTFSVSTSGTYDVVFTFNIVTKEVTVEALKTIYFINSNDWTGTIRCYTFKGSTNNTWPGAAMTNTGLTDDCGHAIYSYQFDAIKYNTVIFTNKTEGSYQTRDIVATDSIQNFPYFDYSANKWNATPPATCSDVYFINTENWANVYCYAWNGNNKNAAWPGVAMTKVTGTTLCEHDVYKYHLSNYTNCIFTNGTTKTRDLDIVPDGYFSFSMQRWYADAAAVTAACVSSSGAPVMTYAETDSVFTRKVTVQVGAIDDNTPFEQIVYYCELATPMGETYKFYQITFHANKPGYFDLINLIPCSEYALTVWAIDNDGLVSVDPMVINFTTACDPLNLYLRGEMNSWATNDADWQFQYHDYEHTRFILIHDVDPDQKYRLWDNAYSVYGPAEGDHDPLYTGDNEGVVVFTATGTNAYISALDEIYIVGPAVAGGAVDWDLTDARKLTWDNPISATWEGNVTYGAEYKLVVRHTSKGGGDAYTWESWDYFGAGNATYNEAFTNAILTFDLLTWTWKWTNADDNLCQKTGFPPAGMTPPDFNGAQHFQMGYEISMYTPDATHLYVTAKSNDWAKKSGSGVPIFMVFPQEDANLKVLEMPMTYTGTNDANGNRIYELTIAQGQKSNNYGTEDLVADFTMGACLRWAVKFPYAGGFSVTDPMYYYIRQGCAPDYFNIYHHDDSPGTKDDTITQFEGGEILQPIIYRRKFNPGAWETLCLPFTCSAVRVYDPDDETEYDLVPQHNSEDAGYWLRTFGGATEREDFKPHWSNVPSGVELPQKDVPYIMMVPDVGGYYDDKYVMFYGKGYQTIADKGSWSKQSAPSTGFFYYGNTTMYPQSLGQAYMISYDGWWFEKSSGNTLYPFECYVVADAATTARFVRMSLTGNKEEQIATGLPSTGSDNWLQYRYDGTNLYLETTADTPLAIYSVDGHLIVSSALNANIEKSFVLPPGIYIIQTQVGLTKLAL